MNKLIRITTIPISLDKLLGGQLSFMKDYYKVTAVSSDKEYLEQVGIKEGVKVYHIEMTRQITPLKDFKSLWKSYRFFRKEKPLIVHTHTPKAGTVGMIAAWIARVPHRLHTVAGLPLLEATGKKRLLLNLVEKITCSCATQIYPNSDGLKNIIEENRFCSPTKLKVIANGSSNGIDTFRFSPECFSNQQRERLKNELGITNADFIFIFVGRLVSDKGINELATAFENISKKSNNAKLLLVGNPERDLDPLTKEAEHIMETNKNIISVGFQPDVRPYFAIADALVFPSYREGFPNVVMQAGAMELPSIVTNINGCNEIIIEGVNGTIIPVKNISALEKKMLHFISNPNYVSQLKENTRRMITSRYEQTVVWQALLEEYRSLEKQLYHV